MTYNTKIGSIIRWIARVLGSLIIAFILFFLIAHLFGEDESGNGFKNTSEVISFILFPVSTLIGLGLAFKWEGLGGIITTIGMVGLFVMRPDLLDSIYLIIPLIPGILYITYWLMGKGKEVKHRQ